MKNIFLKIFTLSLINLVALDTKPGSIKLQNRVEKIGLFTVTFKLYADNFSDEIKFFEYKVDSIPEDIKKEIESLKKLSVDEIVKRIDSGEFRMLEKLQSRGLAKKTEKTNIINVYRKRIEDTSSNLEWVSIKTNPEGKKYIEIPNVKWQEDINVPLDARYFKNKENKIIKIDAVFSDEKGQPHTLTMTNLKGWSDKCFKVIDYPKAVVDKGDIAEAHVRLTDC